jgi:hypothetical protein
LTLWLLGYPDQALQRSHEALSLAQDLSHLYSLVLALSFATRCHVLRREARAVQERAEAAMAICAAQGFAPWLAEETLVHGWALTVQGQDENPHGVLIRYPGMTATVAEAQAAVHAMRLLRTILRRTLGL